MQPPPPQGYPPLPPQFPSQPQGHGTPRKRRMWPWIVLTAVIALGVGGAVGGSGGGGGPTRTVVEHDGLLTISPSATVTVTARPGAVARPSPQGPGTTMGAAGASGIYVVGVDIEAGTWHTAGATDGDCYVALLSALSAGDDSNIITNDNVTGPDTITVGSGVKAVQVSGCDTWHRIGA